MIGAEDVFTKGLGPLFRLIVRFVPYLFFSIRNYCRRPNLKLSFGQKHIVFEDANKTKYNPCFLSLFIENPSNNEFKIDVDSIRINREKYSYCISLNPFFMRCNEGTKPEVKLICLDQKTRQFILQNTATPLILGSHEKLTLPLFLYGNPNFIVDRFADSILWLPRTKISVRLKINSIDTEYGINRRSVYELAINWLGFWDNNANT